ncbi:MAG: aldo/keto reductase [Chloroflexi bacterium]|nr:aldo/keto reductase [Chloroflexota bacterium]
MERVPLGKTGLEVSRLGVGLAEIGYELSLDEVSQAGDVLNAVLDSGINFLDTAACYSISEELIGRTVSKRRSEFVLATKAGHVAGGYDGKAWSYQTVADSVDRSLKRLKTDYLDIVQLHSCGIDVLERGEPIRALQDAKAAGKLRHVSYSGDNEDAHWAVDSGLFDTLQTSFNLTEQGARTTGLLEKAEARGMGLIIKRPIGGGTWARARRGEKTPRGYDNEYLGRAKEMAADGPLPEEPDDPILLALGFTLGQSEVDVAIVGTKDPSHMASNVRMVEHDLPVSKAAIAELQRRWDAHAGSGAWRQLT